MKIFNFILVCNESSTCNAHGECDLTGNCVCITGFASPNCASCIPTYFGADCSVRKFWPKIIFCFIIHMFCFFQIAMRQLVTGTECARTQDLVCVTVTSWVLSAIPAKRIFTALIVTLVSYII